MVIIVYVQLKTEAQVQTEINLQSQGTWMVQ